jgi:hypothetical protein
MRNASPVFCGGSARVTGVSNSPQVTLLYCTERRIQQHLVKSSIRLLKSSSLTSEMSLELLCEALIGEQVHGAATNKPIHGFHLHVRTMKLQKTFYPNVQYSRCAQIITFVWIVWVSATCNHIFAFQSRRRKRNWQTHHLQVCFYISRH